MNTVETGIHFNRYAEPEVKCYEVKFSICILE
jgi:hypothetical protein